MMDRKLTLSLDAQVIDSAKQYAQAHNISLSRMIESYLSAVVKHEQEVPEAYSPTVNRLLGVITLSEDFDFEKNYTNYLRDKYK
ncbi:DUF6364 family protein [Neolewinella lacunae]|uniref:DUF6364 family protein n=1 Tax=Neolewinella lacunae TaxID=1517758 RepID=UPI001CA46C83